MADLKSNMSYGRSDTQHVFVCTMFTAVVNYINLNYVLLCFAFLMHRLTLFLYRTALTPIPLWVVYGVVAIFLVGTVGSRGAIGFLGLSE